nr:bifunctional diaminohydroxyphosphoribosylaminopyrimidine deaminase/5-amino-6-(5-phosphoribosylamino)uracil reductase RibD [candidate division Zixibacteria bacterium]
MAASRDAEYMQLALELAERARGRTSPNPMVGAVIVKDAQIVGRGYHKRAGMPHAEINALAEARDNARGATLYVNLEPCCHYGRTSPCTQEIIKAGIKRVVFALTDPNPVVSGQGARELRKAGIKINFGILRRESELLNEVYLKYITTGRPFVILKTAQTLDGRIAAVSGDSRWVTGSKARRLVHRLRSECDAVGVGVGTVNIDNPELTVRLIKGPNPYRLIISAGAAFSKSIKLFKNNSDARTIVATSASTAASLKLKNIIVWSVKKGRGGVSLDDLLDKAGRFGITSLLIEGGNRLATSLLKEGLVDKHYIFIAPKIIGKGINAVGDLALKRMADAISYRNAHYYTEYEPDLLFVGYPKRSK